MSALIPVSTAELAHREKSATHPVLSYLARLGSENSRRAMSKALVNIVRIARGGQCVLPTDTDRHLPSSGVTIRKRKDG